VTKVFTACPAFGHMMNSQTAASLIALTRDLTIRGMFGGFSSLSFPDIVDLRNVYTSIWFDGMTTSHMLFIDADMQFEPELIFDMLLADKPLIGAIYPRKKFPLSWVGSPIDPPAEPEGNLLELEALGCGAMLIRRDCIENMIEKGTCQVETDLEGTSLKGLLEPHGVKRLIGAFDKIKTDDDRKYKLSEDYSMCHRHRQAGGKVYACINHQLTHLGIHPFSAKYSDMYLPESARNEIGN
jgi:hypothetical protein